MLKNSTDTHFFCVSDHYFSDKKFVCPACGSSKTRTSKVRERKFKDFCPQDENVAGDKQKSKIVDLTFYQRYYRCDSCGACVFPEPISFAEKGSRYTNRLSDLLAEGTFRYSYKRVCDYYGVPASTASVGPIMRRRTAYRESLLPPFDTPSTLGIMELRFYHSTYALIYALKSGSVFCLDLLPDTTEETITAFLNRFDARKVKKVLADPLDSIRNAVCSVLPYAEIIVTDECLRRYAKQAMLEIIQADGKRFPLSDKNSSLIMPQRHIDNKYERKQIEEGLGSRPRLNTAYSFHQKFLDLFVGEWDEDSFQSLMKEIPDDLPEFGVLQGVAESFAAELKAFHEGFSVPAGYNAAITALLEAFKEMPHCIFEVLKARCFLTVSYDTLQKNGKDYRVGIPSERMIKEMRRISQNIKEERAYGLK